ncbi:MAG: Smr/MutS family protein [Paracoccaceae bacterium]
MSRKPRGLRPDEAALWDQVARTATPLSEKPTSNSLVQTTKPKKLAVAERPPIPAFEIGSKTSTAPARHNLAPSVSSSIEATQLRMNKRTFSRMKRGKEAPDGRIDLHGMTAAAAQVALTSYLLRAFSDGKRLILVITGKGRQSADTGPIPTPTGILRHQLPGWLSQAPLNQIVLQVAQSHQRHGGSGAFYVYLARNR